MPIKTSAGLKVSTEGKPKIHVMSLEGKPEATDKGVIGLPKFYEWYIGQVSPNPIITSDAPKGWVVEKNGNDFDITPASDARTGHYSVFIQKQGTSYLEFGLDIE